ncbi:amidophosphoribosyltransferase [Oceanicella actignis]|nr:amidophosphoribosyltransferase [Oceanicella actignis]
MGRVSLLGVFGAHGARRALLRLPEGERLMIAPGALVHGWRVAQIEEKAVILVRGGKSLRLLTPQ